MMTTLVSVLLLINTPVYVFLMDERLYGFEMDEYYCGAFKRVSQSDISGNHDAMPDVHIITQNITQTYPFVLYRQTKDPFTLSVDLTSTYSISRVSIIYSTLNNVASIKLQTENKFIHTVKKTSEEANIFHYKCFGIYARYVTADIGTPQNYNSKVFAIKTWSVRMDGIRQRLLVKSVVEAMHPFSNYNNINSIPGFRFSRSASFVPDRIIDFMSFDNLPMAWFVLKLNSPSYVLTYITHCSVGFPQTFIAYSMDENRKLQIYKEDGQQKIFTVTTCHVMYHHLKEPFVASLIQIYMLYRVPNFNSRIDFRGFVANPLPKVHNVIDISSISDPKLQNEITVNLPNIYRVSGIRLHRIDVLEELCIIYRSQAGEMMSYKDNIIDRNATIFLISTDVKWISLRPFITQELLLSCLIWDEFGIPISSLVISIRGEDFNLGSHRWLVREIFDDVDDSDNFIHSFKDDGSDISLFGNMKDFVKTNPSQRLRSDFLGPDCLTRPWLCEEGLTVSFQIFGNLHPDLNWEEKIMTPRDINRCTLTTRFAYFVATNMGTLTNAFGIGFDASTLVFSIFSTHNVHASSFADVKSCILSVPLTNLRLTPLNLSIIISYEFDFLKEKSTNSSLWLNDYTIGKNDKIIEVDITDKLTHLFRHEMKGRIIRSIWILLGLIPSLNSNLYNNHVVIDWRKIKLSLYKRIKVPKLISQQGSFKVKSGHKGLFSSKRVVISGISTQLNSRAAVHLDDVDIHTGMLGRNFSDSGYQGTFQNEFRYRPINEPFVAESIKLYRPGTSDQYSIQSVKVFGGIPDFDGDEILPIISCGIHGNSAVNQGTGFSIYYTKDEIVGMVKTKDEQYTAKLPLTHFLDNSLNSVVLRWRKFSKQIKLFVNQNSDQNTSPINLNTSNPIPENEYLLFFGQYHFLKAYSYGKFKKFNIWRYPFENREINYFMDKHDETIKFFPERSYGKKFYTTPGCGCENVICACDHAVNDKPQFEKIYEVSKYILTDVSDESMIESSTTVWSNYDIDTNEHFLEFNVPDNNFDETKLENAQIVMDFHEPLLMDDTTIVICNDNYEAFFCRNGSLPNGELKFESENLASMLFEQVKSASGFAKFLLKTESRLNMSNAILKVTSRSLTSGDVGLIAYAHEQEVSVWNIVYPISTKCIHFTYHYKGAGFAYFSLSNAFIGIDNIEESARVYLNQNDGVDNQIEYQVNETFDQVVFRLMKEHVGEGYFVLKDVMFKMGDCTVNAINVVQRADYESDKNYGFILGKTGHVIPAIYVPLDGLANVDTSTKKVFTTHDYFYFGRSLYIFSEKAYTFASTTVFWYFHDRQGDKDILKYHRIDGQIDVVRMRVENEKIRFFVKSSGPVIQISLEGGKWYFFEIYIFNNRDLVVKVFNKDLNYSYEDSNLGDLHNKDMQLKTNTDYVVCLQYYPHKRLSPLEVDQTKLCLEKHSIRACPGGPKLCGICNQWKGYWMSNPIYSCLIDVDCKHVLQNVSMYYHFSFDDLDISSLYDVTKTYSVSLASNKIAQDFGVAGKSAKFSGNNNHAIIDDKCSNFRCFFASWMKHRCINDFTMLSGSEFQLKCLSTSSLPNLVHMVLETRKCSYKFHAKGGLWYHLSILINDLSVTIQIDGRTVELEEDCSIQHDSPSSKFTISTTNNEWLFMDEFSLNNVNPFSYPIVDFTRQEFLKKRFPQHLKPSYWVIFYLQKIEYDPDFSIHGHKKQKYLLDAVNNTLTTKYGIKEWSFDKSRFSVHFCSSKNKLCIRTIVAIDPSDLEILREIKSSEDLLHSVTQDSQQWTQPRDTGYTASLSKIRSNSVATKIETGKQYIVFQWTEPIENSVPLKGLYITALHDRFENVNMTSYDIDRVNISGLRGYTKYEICISPISLHADTPDNIYKKCFGDHRTNEAEPLEAPMLNCTVSSETEVTCIVSNISADNFFGIENSYRVYSAVSREINDTHLDVNNWNLENFTMDEKPWAADKTEYVFTIQTDVPFEFYTILALATTQGGDGLGVRSNITLRSHDGAPEGMVLPIEATADIENNLTISWLQLEEDEEIWNSVHQSTWFYEIRVTSHNFAHVDEQPINTYIQNASHTLSSVVMDMSMVQPLEQYSVFRIEIRSGNEYGKCGINVSFCVLFPGLQPTFVDGHMLEIKDLYAIPYIQSWNITMGSDFLPAYIRSERSYLFIVHAVNHTSFTNATIKTIVQREGCQAKSDNYWLKIFCQPFALHRDVNNYIGHGDVCNKTVFSEYTLQQDKERTFTLEDFHPYTWYLITVFACNEFGCSSEFQAKRYFLTDEYKPGAGPENVTLTSPNSTSLEVTFGLIDEFYQHGIILGYHLKLSCKSVNLSRFINDTTVTPTTTVFTGLDKYENCCVIVSGFTSFPELGNYSKPVCNKTLEDIPDKAPSNFQIRRRNSRWVRVRWDSFLQEEWNGEPLKIVVNYSCYLRNGSIEQYVEDIKPERIFYTFRNLYPYTNCSYSVAACTKIGCNISHLESFLTKENVSDACPKNFTMIGKSSTCLNFSWGEIDIMQQNGVIEGYNVLLTDGTDEHVKKVSNLSVSFCDLTKFQMYDAYLAGVTSAGIGYQCKLQHSTDEDLPCAPANISVTSYYTDYLIVDWEDVPVNCQNGIILGFVIFYYEAMTHNNAHPQNTIYINDRKVRQTKILNVTAGNTYNVSVAGITRKGVGERTIEKQMQLGRRVDGGWTDWTVWNPCTASCGPAFRYRSRDCLNPKPENGGLNCTGKKGEVEDCKHPPCSGYVLAPPGKYDCKDYCSRKKMLCTPYMDTEFNIILKDIKINCGSNRGDKKYLEAKHPGIMDSGKQKKCVGYDGAPNKTVCTIPDNPNEEQYRRICHCIHENDIGFDQWGPWSACTITCGYSQFRKRSRNCEKEKCRGPSEQSSNCLVPPCPVVGNWGRWTGYEICNKTCGWGFQNRRRFCNDPTPRYGGRNCTGPGIAWLSGCNKLLCPVHGRWGRWTRWSAFTKPCGNCSQLRTRECDSPAPNHRGNMCSGNRTEIKLIRRKACVPNNIYLVLVFGEEKFVYQMNYLHHDLTRTFSDALCQELYRMILNTTNFYDCNVYLYRKGSVIVHMGGSFEYVDAEQVVHIVDTLDKMKSFIGKPITSFQVNTTTVPCPPPSNIEVEELNGGRVNISFTVERCYDGTMPNLIYVFYVDDKKTSDISTWEWVGVFSEESNILVKELIPYVKYRARLLSSTDRGNGIPGKAIYFTSTSGPPLTHPPDLRHVSISPTSIYIEWRDLPVVYRNGELLGYKVMYKRYFDKKYTEKVISFGFKNTILEGLKPFTWYIILVCAFNRGGNGPTDYSIVQTLEGVPSIPVPNVVITDMQALDWWSVTWNQIPDEYVNGNLLGYRLKYYLSYRSGQPVGGQKNYVIYDFDIYTFYHEEKNLLSYATYNVTVTGFTKTGEGPIPEYFAKTCHCPPTLFGNWYIKPPYTEIKNNELDGGIFPDLIKKMIVKACGGCAQYKMTQLYYNISKTPFHPNTKTEIELKRRISDEVDVSLPLYGRKEIKAIVPNSVFISMISSPGCAMIIRNETDVEGILNSMIMGVVSVWPMLLVSYAIATLFGILVWFTDQTKNPEEFNIGSSLRGPCIGFWFSFVTMTTVGYGDLTPRSFLARSISMVWFLVGLVLNGIIVGFITSAVTSINIVEEHSLYNTLTGTVNNTFEQRYAVMRNARLPDETYTNVDGVLDALSSSKVDAALIDIYAMASYKPILKEKKLKVVRLIDARTGYGFALSGFAQVLKPDLESLVIQNQNVIGEFVASLEDDIPELTVEKAGSASADIFSATSPAFITSCTYMGILILSFSIIGLIVDRILWLKKRMKISAACGPYDDLEVFADDLLEFCLKTKDLCASLEQKNDEEFVQLVMYQRAYTYKIETLGKFLADRIIEDSHQKKGVSHSVSGK